VTVSNSELEKNSNPREFLTIFLNFQEKIPKSTRYFISCFNVTPEFFTSFQFPKSRGGDLFSVKYMEAVFNREAESGEFFIEFVEPVLENKLIECFEAQGAGQVTTITFANDGSDSAASALVRILLAQEKHGGCSRGTCPATLYKNAMAKRTEAKQKLQTVSQQEFDEKTAAAIRLSLGNIETGVQSQAVKLDGIETGVQSQAAKLDGIEQGVCHVIPDYQNENAKLKDALAKKTAACDTIEGKLAYKTRLVNQQGKYIDKLDDEQQLLKQQNQALVRKEEALLTQIALLKEQLELSQYLKQTLEKSQQTLEKSQHLADILSSTLAEERAAKRRRE